MDDLVTQKISFIKRFKSRQHLRLHMSLILLATVCSGLLATRIMLALQLQNVMVRYPLAVIFAYLTFFIGVKLWLKYVASFLAVRSSRDTSSHFSKPIFRWIGFRVVWWWHQNRRRVPRWRRWVRRRRRLRKLW